jgi:hypothetical protein
LRVWRKIVKRELQDFWTNNCMFSIQHASLNYIKIIRSIWNKLKKYNNLQKLARSLHNSLPDRVLEQTR